MTDVRLPLTEAQRYLADNYETLTNRVTQVRTSIYAKLMENTIDELKRQAAELEIPARGNKQRIAKVISEMKVRETSEHQDYVTAVIRSRTDSTVDMAVLNALDVTKYVTGITSAAEKSHEYLRRYLEWNSSSIIVVSYVASMAHKWVDRRMAGEEPASIAHGMAQYLFSSILTGVGNDGMFRVDGHGIGHLNEIKASRNFLQLIAAALPDEYNKLL